MAVSSLFSRIFFFRFVRFVLADLGGHPAARRLWRDYFAAIDGIVFMTDAVEMERFPEARQVAISPLKFPMSLSLSLSLSIFVLS